jgi:hypothetical protein
MPTLAYAPPPVAPGNVVWGLAAVFTSPQGTSLPTDANLGVGSAWTAAGWNFNGATDSGVSLNWNPSTTDINIEEQPTPVAVLIEKVDYTISFDFSEETLQNIALAYGGSGSVAVTAPGAGQPGKSVLTLSTTYPTLNCAVVGRNQLGYARVFYIPGVMSVGSVKTDFRRSASQRLYPCELSMTCPFSALEIVDLTAPATS